MMRIYGLQKLTLLDFPGHTGCTVFTGGCNFRCPFCHNARLVTERLDSSPMEEDTFLQFLEKRKGILDGVCITGGEPLLQADIDTFIRRVREKGFLVKLDTNGSFPEKLKSLLEAGLLDYVAMDIKNCFEKYSLTAGVEVDTAKIDASIDLLMHSGIEYEFRTTVVREYHTEEDIEKIARWIQGAKRFFLQHFVDSGNLIGKNCSAVDEEIMIRMRERVLPLVPATAIRGL